MSKCDNCKVKKFYAKRFDLHWFGEDDCPYECNESCLQECDKEPPESEGE